MLPRIVLFVLQLAAAWFIAPVVKSALPALLARPYDLLIDAVIIALIVMIVGFAGSLILKEVPSPSGATLIAALLLALVLAGLATVPAIQQVVEGIVPALRNNRILYPLVGAFAGYYLKR